MKCGISLLTLSLCLIGCVAQNGTTVASEGRISPTYAGPTETSFCTTTMTFSDAVVITGSANYIRREIWGNLSGGGLGTAVLTGSHAATQNPIRQAEVRVTDPSGAAIQCGTTDDSGAFTVRLPRGNVTYTVSVNSRAYNNALRVSVLNQPEKNQFYSLSTTVVADRDQTLATFTANANGDVLGGAFNIMDQIYKANIYLRSQVTNCTGAGFTGCRNVSASNPLPKVTAYWSKGFNPNSYFGATSGLSFYLPGYDRLFILGGQNGDVDSSDTDHFDSSVIIHEYGHFLEDVAGNSDSPGGQHTGTKIIDPRLAWSEGWGNFFQAAVRNEPHYIDTMGNDDGVTDLAFYVDLETVTSSAGYDYPTIQGEGNFREFAVTRLLWDAVDSAVDTANSATDNVVSGAFDEIWSAFTSSTHGFAFSSYAFRNVGLLHLVQKHFNIRNWASIRGVNLHDGDEGQYGQYVTTTGCGSAPYTTGGNSYYFQITPALIATDDGTYAHSDLLRNNDFFHFRAPASGSHTLTLRYQDANGVGTEADLDFFVYNENYTFADSDTLLGYSADPRTGVTNVENEPVAGALHAGANYLLNVNVFTGNGIGTAANYNILYDGVPLCPGNLVPL